MTLGGQETLPTTHKVGFNADCFLLLFIIIIILHELILFRLRNGDLSTLKLVEQCKRLKQIGCAVSPSNCMKITELTSSTRNGLCEKGTHYIYIVSLWLERIHLGIKYLIYIQTSNKSTSTIYCSGTCWACE